MKAQIDRSKLVQVQRMVSRGGKTFPQNFWVKPSEVKSTDKVLQGQQNLLPKAGSVPKPAAGVLDKAYFDSIESDRAKALDYLKSCGISWTENAHAGINWMRAKQALNAALGGQGTTKTSSQVKSQPQSNKTVSAQNSQSNGQQITLTQKQQDELNDCKNGREKVVVLKKLLGANGCMDYARSIGVSWDEHTHTAINNMRMSMALQTYFDTVDGTVSPKGGAPKGNKNAAGNSGNKNPDELPVTANDSERTKAMKTLINGISDETELKNFASIGMIPEDDVSKSFLLDKLVPKYAVFAAAHAPKTSSGSSQKRYNSNSSYGFADQMAYDLKFEGCKKEVVGQGMKKIYENFNMAILVDPRSEIGVNFGRHAYSSRFTNTTLGILGDLRSAFSQYTTDDYINQQSYYGGKYVTNLGYTGTNPKTYTARYDKDKEGFVRYLRQIMKDNPQSAMACARMIDDYDEIMGMVEHNPIMLENVLGSSSWWSDKPDEVEYGDNRSTDLGRLARQWNSNITPWQAKTTISSVNKQKDLIVSTLLDRGLSIEAIEKTLNKSWYNDNLKDFHVYDENGDDTGQRIDFTTIVKNGVPVLKETTDSGKSHPDQRFGNQTLKYIHDAFVKEYLQPDLESDCLDDMEYLKQIADFSEDKYLQVHDRVFRLFGQHPEQLQSDGTYKTIDATQLNAHNFSSDCSSCLFEKNNSDSKEDLVYTHLLMASLTHRANTEIVDDISDNFASKLNQQGGDYSGNYTYYSADKMSGQSERRKQYSGQDWKAPDAKYTVDELNAQIQTQMESMPQFSTDYLSKVSDFYNAKSNYQDAAAEAKKDTFGKVGINLEDYTDEPIKDVLFQTMNGFAQFIPSMSARGKDKLADLMAKRMDYVPFDYSSPTQKKLSDLNPKKSNQSAPKTDLRKLREDLLKAANCTVAVEDEDTSLQMRKQFLQDWDYSDGHAITDPSGRQVQGRKYSGPNSFNGRDRRALFNSRFFRVKNSNMEQPFQDYKTELTDSEKKEYELFHGCSYASTAGIIGKTGGWFMGNQYTKVAKALGNGAYFGFRGGKSSVYCGEGSGGYANLDPNGAQGDRANGCYILATVMKGKPADHNESGGFRDWEMAVKNNKCILPHHFVDISCRSLDVNVKRDSQGYYVDDMGNRTHDRYGKKLDMK